MKICAFILSGFVGLFFLWVALVVAFNWRWIVRSLRCQWMHRRDYQLYDDVWRRPDGKCVNDAGEVWDQYWQRTTKDGK